MKIIPTSSNAATIIWTPTETPFWTNPHGITNAGNPAKFHISKTKKYPKNILVKKKLRRLTIIKFPGESQGQKSQEPKILD